MLRTGILLATFIVTAVSIGLIGRIILGERNAKTGILSLSVGLHLLLLRRDWLTRSKQFNSTNILADSPFLKSRTVQNRDILQDIQSKVNSVKDAAAIATGVSDIKSINFGGIRGKDGSKLISKAVAVTGEDITLIKELLAKDIELEIRQVPTDSKQLVGQLIG